MPTLRLFIALALPDVHRALLTGLYETKLGFAWTRPEQLHVTLRFLGDVGESAVEPLADALGRIRVAPFWLPLEGVGVFPPRGSPKVIWAGVGRGHPLLFQLRQRLDDALLAFGLDLDVRLFHPHVTLARLKTATAGDVVAATHFIKRHREFAGPPFRVTRFGLYASQLTPQGAVHRLRREFPLHTDPAQAFGF